MNRVKRLLVILILLTSAVRGWAEQPKILVYTKNGKGYVHDNIPTTIEVIKKLGADNGLGVDASTDSTVFTDANLKQYRVLVFSNTNNETIDTEEQQAAFQRYIRGGGGFVGIHSACGSERNWDWFAAMLGGRFARHPRLQPFTIHVRDRKHPSTAHLGETWKWEDEFYYLTNMPNDLHILLTGDLTTLDDSKKPAGKTSPLAWCHEFEGGRCWYTALGHKKEYYHDANFQKHILGGIRWAMGEQQEKK